MYALKMWTPLLFLFITNLVTYCKTSGVGELKCLNHNFTHTNQRDKNAEDYCKVNKCIAKCCPLGQLLEMYNNTFMVCNDYTGAVNYNDFPIYKNNITNKKEVSDKTITNQFEFVYDAKFLIHDCTGAMRFDTPQFNYYIKENGELAIEQLENLGNWLKRNELEYCMEFFHAGEEMYRVYHVLDTIVYDYTTVELIMTIGLLLSSFFLFLTLVVYCLLPYLRNINGMIQMAHVGGVMIMFLLKIIIAEYTTNEVCRHAAPIYYFYIISNFLWLAVMSFNIWWTFRGTLNHRKVHRRGEMVKFLVYCLTVYGIAGALTIFATVIDRTDMSHLPNFKTPGLTACLSNSDGMKYYVYIPVAILISINCTLFIMTLYNIWKIKKGIEKFNSSETKSNRITVSSFKIYAKLSVMMGVSWIVEVAQMDIKLPPTPHILVNFYNSYIGVIIFILLMSDKKKIAMLCQRFNIKHKWIPKIKESTSDSSRSPSNKISGKRADQGMVDTVELSSVENNNRNSNVTA